VEWGRDCFSWHSQSDRDRRAVTAVQSAVPVQMAVAGAMVALLAVDWVCAVFYFRAALRDAGEHRFMAPGTRVRHVLALGMLVVTAVVMWVVWRT